MFPCWLWNKFKLKDYKLKNGFNSDGTSIKAVE